jgi:predicted transcriptional regulator
MDVHFKPETESRLQELATQTGRAPDELIKDAIAGYLFALAPARETLDSRYDDIKSGRVKPIDGEEAFGRLRPKGEARQTSRS